MKKKNKKTKIIIILAAIVIILTGVLLYIFRDKNKLNILEKQWISDNEKTLINLSIINNANNFGVYGDGVFFDFITDFETEYNLTINENSTTIGGGSSGLAFKVKEHLNKNDLLFFEDHFVIAGKNNEIVTSINMMSGKKAGVITGKYDYVAKKIGYLKLELLTFDSREALAAALAEGDIDYIVVPQNEYLDLLITNNYYSIYHLNELPVYYTLELTGSDRLSSILRKYYNKWIKTTYSISYNEALFSLFKTSLNITEKDADVLTSKVYNYGFISNAPYEINVSGSFGGINAVALKKFTDFSNIEFKFIKYKDYARLMKAIKKGDVDLYFDTYNNIASSYTKSININPIQYVIFTRENNNMVINSLESLKNKPVYALKDSIIADYINKNANVELKTYDNEKQLLKLAKKDNTIVMDETKYELYHNSEIKNTTVKFNGIIDASYVYGINGDATFQKLFNSYTNFLDMKKVNYEGLNNYQETVKSGRLITKLASFSLYVVLIGAAVGYFIYRSSRRITISKKIKKEDKMRYIDMLTSLKNRNYLNDNIENWDNNTVYPQTIIIVDLNAVKKINDIHGHEEGDKQIQAAANALMNTQIDNSEIIRTNGNEFLIYLVGYQDKQILNYIRKLTKELKSLPYDFGTAIGYSMIEDDLKLIDDAINEATIMMRKDKESNAKDEKKN